ncbi:MAG: hypothetical protein WBX27_11645 [Specibacter sp.]
MTIRHWIAIVLSSVFLLIAGLGVAERLELEWLRVVVMAVCVAGAPLAVMVFKKRDQKRSRSSEPDSMESKIDESVRAASFVDALVITSVATAISAMLPWVQPWILGFALLAAYGISYWLRSALFARRIHRASV